jgi:hypothetical protein
MPEAESNTAEWSPADDVETRRFRCDIVEEDGGEGVPRLQLMADASGRRLLVIRVPAKHIDAVRKELRDRGYRGTLPVTVRGQAGYGSWLGYLNELEVAHIVVEMLGWTLTTEEQASLDAVDDYGRRAPTGFRSPRLR